LITDIDSEVDNAIDLSIFEQEELDDETWNKSLHIIDAHFDEFQKFFNRPFECVVECYFNGVTHSGFERT
jgi:hypothetical protein